MYTIKFHGRVVGRYPTYMQAFTYVSTKVGQSNANDYMRYGYSIDKE